MSNHDVVRHATRYGLPHPARDASGRPARKHGNEWLLSGGAASTVDADAGIRRARAASLFVLGLPGSAYIYQGEELGLPEVVELPDAARQDPTFFRTEGKLYGRDGCRVPIPWEADEPAAGFSPTGESWLPQPESWGSYARDTQRGVPGSTLELYTAAIAARREHSLATGEIEWLDAAPDVIAFRSGGVTILANTGSTPVPLPAGEVILSSGPVGDGLLPGDTTVWLH